MPGRLAGHTRITRLRSRRAPVPDPEFAEIRDEVAGSGLIEEIEPLVARRTGCPRKRPGLRRYSDHDRGVRHPALRPETFITSRP